MDLTRAGMIAGLRIGGAAVGSKVAEAVTEATLDLSTTQTSELVLTVADPELELIRANAMPKRTPVSWDDLSLEVAVRALATVGGGPGLTVTLRARGIQALKRRKGARVWKGQSYSTWMRSECRAVGLDWYGESTPKLAQVVRGKDESSWDVCTRAAREVGHIVFEAFGKVYFAKPTWLAAHLPRQDVAYGAGSDVVYGFPDLRDSDDDTTAGITGTVSISPGSADVFRPGRGVKITGLGTYNGTYQVTSLSATLDGVSLPSVGLATPINPAPEPPESSADSSGKKVSGSRSASAAYSSLAGGKTIKGDTQAKRFVNYALDQIGDRYIFGAEASLNDPNPSAFDCSELVQWASHRVGVYLPDGSAAQRSYCYAHGGRVSIATGEAHLGYLLFGNGHVAISLGGGQIVEAANARAGIRRTTSAGRPWIGAARIPKMSYTKDTPTPHGAVPAGSI